MKKLLLIIALVVFSVMGSTVKAADKGCIPGDDKVIIHGLYLLGERYFATFPRCLEINGHETSSCVGSEYGIRFTNNCANLYFKIDKDGGRGTGVLKQGDSTVIYGEQDKGDNHAICFHTLDDTRKGAYPMERDCVSYSIKDKRSVDWWRFFEEALLILEILLILLIPVYLGIRTFQHFKSHQRNKS